jgi:GMP synthase-like glutamine amidotransferase
MSAAAADVAAATRSKSAIKFWGMKPVAIFRSAPTEGPGYFASYLERRSIPWQLVALDEGETVPRDARRFSGLVFMGGPMSVNDDLAWIIPALELIRDAVRKDVPVLGHCLGGQLMSKAFGGVVKANPVKEIGWGEVRVADNNVARTWLGERPAFESFHWHGETFSIPPGATRILEGRHCANQAFALGKHLGMQCHVEMTDELVNTWLETGGREIDESRKSPAVQSPGEIRKELGEKLGRLNEVATALYDRWTEGLSRGS